VWKPQEKTAGSPHFGDSEVRFPQYLPALPCYIPTQSHAPGQPRLLVGARPGYAQCPQTTVSGVASQ